MPLHMNHVSQLRKSEKTKATDILFTIGSKQFKKLNIAKPQKQYKIELIDYPDFTKVKVIKHIKSATKKTIPEIQKMLESMPIVLSKQLTQQEAKTLESKLIMLGCRIRIT